MAMSHLTQLASRSQQGIFKSGGNNTNTTCLGCPPKFLTILRQIHEGQMGQVKHNGALSDSFPIANGVKQGCVLVPTLFSILFSMMLQEVKEDLVDGIFIRFRTDGSIFNLCHLLAHTKTIEILIVELLFCR